MTQDPSVGTGTAGSTSTGSTAVVRAVRQP